ncbi:MAG TPA: hypothetical protein VI316_13395 [Candidatus Dormibacteraeota bacterium]
MTAAPLLERWRQEDARRHLEAFLRRQRWFGGRGRDVTGVAVVDAIPLREGDLGLCILLVAVRYFVGDDELYHLPLVSRRLTDAAVTGADDPRLVLLDGEDSDTVAVYDALADPGALEEVWRAIAAGEVHHGKAGDVRMRRLRPPTAGAQPDGGTAIRPLAREQSNSAAVRGDTEMLKCLRHVVRGVSPEVEMTTALLSAGFERVAAPLGTVEYLGHDGTPILLALIQSYLGGGTEGWALALTSLRVHYADAEEAQDEHAGREEAAIKGATFTPEAIRIGALTAALHLAMLDHNLPAALRAFPAGRDLLERWAAEMTVDLDRLLGRPEPQLDGLRARRDAIAATFAALRDLPDGGMAIRVHGDYHLSQLLRTDEGWTVLDFEGEPRRPLVERRAHSSPLSDVAGMLRSFHYAAAVELRERTPPDEQVSEVLQEQGDAWVAANRDAFWAAYTAAVAGSGLLPSGDGVRVMIRAFELRKGIYEVGYELGHRPDWLSIPLRSLLAAGPAAVAAR